jgi:hypothetical protein
MASIDLRNVEYINIDLFAERTGENIFFSIHDTGCATAGFTPNVISATAWSSYLWDISSIASGDKDSIDIFSIEIIDASAANTFYVDNVYGIINSTITATAQPLAFSLKSITAGISPFIDVSTLALTANLKGVTYQSSISSDAGAINLSLFAPFIKIDSSVSPDTLQLTGTLKDGTPFLITRIIRKGYEFGAMEQVTHTKLNNIADTAIWEISNQVAGDMFYYEGTSPDKWKRIPVGTEGQVLTMNASGQPRWA